MNSLMSDALWLVDRYVSLAVTSLARVQYLTTEVGSS